MARNHANEKYYGHHVSPKEILTGAVKPPPGAAKLQRALADGSAERVAVRSGKHHRRVD